MVTSNFYYLCVIKVVLNSYVYALLYSIYKVNCSSRHLPMVESISYWNNYTSSANSNLQ